MKQVDEMPTSGRFIAVWECDKNIHSYKLQWIGNMLYEASEKDGSLSFIDGVESLIKYHGRYNTKYFVEED